MHANKDYYDKNGILLLAKDQEVTERTLVRLRQLDIDSKGVPNKGTPNKTGGHECAKRIGITQISKKLNVREEHMFDRPAQVLCEILFESRTKPWWFAINALSNYIGWIYTHSVNVGLISLILAESMGYGQRPLWEIGLGALLHDIGKLMIPKSIIQKKGALNTQEMAYIRQHCELGASIVADCEIPEASKKVILQHHERNDGSGYPSGLKVQDSIHQFAQIAMVADVVDAITTDRPYRPAKDIGTAIAILKEDKNKFSQPLVDRLAELLAEASC